MKKLNKVMGFVGVLLYSLCICCHGLDFDNFSLGKTSLDSESVTSCDLGDGIVKKETTSVVSYIYNDDLSESLEKYVTVKISITYRDERTDKILAIAAFESNFRYNSSLKTAECLSASKGSVSNDGASVLDVFSRATNSTCEIGGSVDEVKFKNKGKSYEENQYKITCDYMGNIMVK